jgi:hypothetical protein
MRLYFVFLYLLFSLASNGHESVNPAVSFEGFGNVSVEKARFGDKVRDMMVFEEAVVAVVGNHVFINRDYYGEFKRASFLYDKGVVRVDGRVVEPVKLSKEVAIDCFGVLKGREVELLLPDGVRIIVDGTMHIEVDDVWRPSDLRPLFEDNHLLFHIEDILIEKKNDFWIICSKWKIPLLSKSKWEIKYSIENGKFILVEGEKIAE